jgi:hypothetical protein
MEATVSRHGRSGSRMRGPLLALAGLALCSGMAGCLPDADPQAVARVGSAGWCLGWLHGWMVPVNAVRSCFDPSVGIHSAQNTGFWYDLWFVLGWLGVARFLGLLVSLAGKGAERLLGLVDDVEEEGAPSLMLRWVFRGGILCLPMALVAVLWWVNAGSVDLIPPALAGQGSATFWELLEGLWHSMICFISLVVSFFNHDVAVVSGSGRGTLYNIGWAFGGVSIGAIASASWRLVLIWIRRTRLGRHPAIRRAWTS